MKTNTIQAITASVLTGLIAGFGSTTVTGNLVTGLSVAVSIWAVIALFAMAFADYSSGARNYAQAPLATEHFQGTTSAPSAIRTPVAKTRLAA